MIRHSHVRALLERCRGRRIWLFKNPGNCGDGLIQRGFEQLCAELSVTWRLWHPGQLDPQGILLVQGGGNWCETFHTILADVERLQSGFAEVIVLPSTIDPASGDVRRWLQELPRHVRLMVREKTSHEQCRLHVPHASQVELDHDLAFAADYSPWRRAGSGHLHAFRVDPESSSRQLPADNWDISSIGGESDGVLLLDLVADYATIRTDRAHVAIAGTLLGKEVVFFPGNYFKARALFEHSLRHFPNVRFVTDFQELHDWVEQHPTEIREAVHRREGWLRLLSRQPVEPWRLVPFG